MRFDDVLVRRVPMRSGRVLLDAWQLWPNDKSLPKDRSCFRDDDGLWYWSLPLVTMRAVIDRAFPDAKIGTYHHRWSAYEEILDG